MSNEENLSDEELESIFDTIGEEDEVVEEAPESDSESESESDESESDESETEEVEESDEEAGESESEEEEEEQEEDKGDEETGVEEKSEESEAEKRAKELEEVEQKEAAERAQLEREIDSYVDFNDIKEGDKLLDISKLPETNIKVGDEVLNLKEFANEYPAMTEAMNVITSSVAQKAVQQAVAPLVGELTTLRFKSDLVDLHSDGWGIIQSKEFADWLGEQTETMQKLAYSNEIKDSGLLISEYKKSIAPPKVEEKKEPKVPVKKKKMDKVLKNNIKKKSEPVEAPESDENFDPEKFFDEIEVD